MKTKQFAKLGTATSLFALASIILIPLIFLIVKVDGKEMPWELLILSFTYGWLITIILIFVDNQKIENFILIIILVCSIVALVYSLLNGKYITVKNHSFYVLMGSIYARMMKPLVDAI